MFSNSQMFTKKKDIIRHPWETTIKDKFLNNIKHAHNSISNPQFNDKKKTRRDSGYIKFSVIGNRVTKEFIYCVHLVKGLSKYRKNKFDSPNIRGVNSVEWPLVLHDLKSRYGGLAYSLAGQVAVLMNDNFLGGEKELRELIEAKYNYHIYPDYYKEAVAEFVKYVDGSCRPCVYMHISINDDDDGTMIFMLYSDIVPRTCENFMRLCKEKRGGYSGTPVHRIVKDGWIQCGGFGLKATKLDCENFIIPHDRRGVLCMANDGRHIDCSTQFFVLLQPARWMENKYVAFGQLIDGADTLDKIENVPTWYEAPTCEITIFEAGILNLECQDIVINKGINEYIQGHIENLTELGEEIQNIPIFRMNYWTYHTFDWERMLKSIRSTLSCPNFKWIFEKLFSGSEFMDVESGEEEEIQEDRKNVRATKRFIRRKEEIEKQLETSQIGDSESSLTEDLNEDFDVENYESEIAYEMEEASKMVSDLESIKKVEVPFYIPLTDVPYPGEIDSTHDLKKFLKGHYCLERDLLTDIPKIVTKQQKMSYTSEMFNFSDMHDSGIISLSSLDSDDEIELRRYIKLNVDRVSFAGGIVRGIARGVGKFNIFEDARKSELVTDEDLKRFRSASVDMRGREQERKVSIMAPESQKPSKIKRRATGYPSRDVVEKIAKKKSSLSIAEEETIEKGPSSELVPPVDLRKVRIAATLPSKGERRKTSERSNAEVHRHSTLTRLMEDVAMVDETGPILKDYKPMSESKVRNILLTRNMLVNSDFIDVNGDDNARDKYLRPSLKIAETPSFDRLMNIQHGKKLVRKISSDYVKTLGQMEQPLERSIRSIEFAKKRPSMTIAQYQKKNQMLRESLKEPTNPAQ